MSVESHNLHADRACSTSLNLVFMSEEIHTCLSSTVIEIALD